MKTGNAILGVFFLWMAFNIPITIITILLEHDWINKLPVDLYIIIFSIFGVFVSLGIITFISGGEKKPPQTPDFFFH